MLAGVVLRVSVPEIDKASRWMDKVERSCPEAGLIVKFLPIKLI